jgi:aminoglycoside 6'-N-acetyltransferase
VKDKLRPILEKEKNLFAFIVLVDEKPIGYVQYCPISENPWPEQEIEEKVVNCAAGLDLFIGDPESIGKGLGSKIVQAFLDTEIWPKFSFCFVDPDLRNEASKRCFEKCGFEFHKTIRSEDALKRPVTLTLMKKSRSSNCC